MSLAPFDQIVREHGPVVHRVCRALVGPHDADDAWSETFLSALRAYPDLRPDSDVRAWLVTIAHRRTIDQLRATGRRPRPVGSIDDASQVAAESGTGGSGVAGLDRALRDAVAALPDKQRAAVAYRYLGDLSYGQIAELLDCSEAAARRSAADGIGRLRVRVVGPDPTATNAGEPAARTPEEQP